MRRAAHFAVLTVAVLIATAGVLVGLGTLSGEPPPAPPTPRAPAPAPDPVRVASVPGPIGVPTRVVVPAIGVDEALTGLGLEPDGAMTMPAFGAAGWYREGPRPGDPGPAVVVAHVRGPAGPDVFWDLATLESGDLVTVYGTGGRATFAVESVETVDKDELPYDRIWPETDEPLLRLITCGGEPDQAGAGFPANTIVYARPA